MFRPCDIFVLSEVGLDQLPYDTIEYFEDLSSCLSITNVGGDHHSFLLGWGDPDNCEVQEVAASM